MRWHEVAEGFARDGALRDIYVFGTSAREWQDVYDAIRSAYRVLFHDLTHPPDDVRELLNAMESCTITVEPDGLDINCHFFTEDEIEFDLSPDGVTSRETLDPVCRFMQVVGRAAGKDAVLVVEDGRDWIILRFDVKTDAVFAGSHAGIRLR